MKRYILTMLIAVVALAARAQNMTKKSTVIGSSDNEPVVWATVKEKGTSTGAVTDFDGNYQILADKNATFILPAVSPPSEMRNWSQLAIGN